LHRGVLRPVRVLVLGAVLVVLRRAGHRAIRVLAHLTIGVPVAVVVFIIIVRVTGVRRGRVPQRELDKAGAAGGHGGRRRRGCGCGLEREVEGGVRACGKGHEPRVVVLPPALLLPDEDKPQGISAAAAVRTPEGYVRKDVPASGLCDVPHSIGAALRRIVTRRWECGDDGGDASLVRAGPGEVVRDVGWVEREEAVPPRERAREEVRGERPRLVRDIVDEQGGEMLREDCRCHGGRERGGGEEYCR
jgi:hypothetical protein